MAVGTAGDRAESTYFARAIVDSRATLHLSYRLAVRFVQWTAVSGAASPGTGLWRAALPAFVVLDLVTWHLLRRNQRFGLGWRLVLDCADMAFWSLSPLPPSQYYDNAVLIGIPLSARGRVPDGHPGDGLPRGGGGRRRIRPGPRRTVGPPLHRAVARPRRRGGHGRVLLLPEARRARRGRAAAGDGRPTPGGRSSSGRTRWPWAPTRWSTPSRAWCPFSAVRGKVPLSGGWPTAGRHGWRPTPRPRPRTSRWCCWAGSRRTTGTPISRPGSRSTSGRGRAPRFSPAARWRGCMPPSTGATCGERCASPFPGRARSIARRVPRSTSMSAVSDFVFPPTGPRPSGPSTPDPSASPSSWPNCWRSSSPAGAGSRSSGAGAGIAACGIAAWWSHRRLLELGPLARPAILRGAVATALAVTFLTSALVTEPVNADGDTSYIALGLMLLAFIGGLYTRRAPTTAGGDGRRWPPSSSRC